MLDNNLGLLAFSVAGAIASIMARRRKPTLATLSNEDLLATLADLHANILARTAQHPQPDRTAAAFMNYGASDEERRRITVLISEEIERRHGSRERYG